MSNYPEEFAKRQNDEERVRKYQLATYGRRFCGANLATIAAGTHSEKLASFLEKPQNFLIYCGSPGIGKTYFCAALTEWAFRTFDSYRYWDESDLLRRIRAEMDSHKGDYLDTLKWLTDDQLVILDDVGSTGIREWREEVLFDFIDSRYNSMLPTVITSNFTEEEFRKLYHPRVCDRLFATENIIIEIKDGVSFRTKGL